ncbi:unnamed protein product [Cuscuta epithymum]|uniref:Retrotransposon Copia-like N-terminal domain-containing protein n=1 Tax=Cuscuta epithymum TaxID=186058 RepID=A0AAV0C3F0_9ASTE|nr:unnamed protein product [Cuscuta epithymum]
MQVTVHRLNGSNYLEWSQSVKLAIDGRGKLGFLTGETKVPEPDEPNYKVWRSENSLVTAWLLNSMDASIARSHMFLKTAKEVWDAVRETYSDLENFAQTFELKTQLWKSKQGQRDVTTYYNEMVSFWQELDHCNNDVWENKNDQARQKKREENDRVFMFLAGVNQNLDDVKGRLLGRRPLPSIREVFSEVRLEENRRKIMSTDKHLMDSDNAANDASALVVRNNEQIGDQKKKPWCDFCKKLWHTRDTCWKIHGKPPGWKPKSDRALHTMVEPPAVQQVKSETAQFTQGQIVQILKMISESDRASSGTGLGKDDWQC